MTAPASLLRPFDDRTGFTEQLRTLITEATESLLLVATDFSDWPLDDMAVHAALREFLHEHRQASLQLLLDDTRHLGRAAPRFCTLRRHYSHLIECRCTPRVMLEEPCAIADERHMLRRFDNARFRGELALDARQEVDELLMLYRPLWNESTPCLPATTLGL
ncbi:MAG: hypothetical protein JSW68_09910 [Burkholderiales bacterium]|nr:MAG: hypothetical protein JSW68_09910 [Burkholderiales bacterium]